MWLACHGEDVLEKRGQELVSKACTPLHPGDEGLNAALTRLQATFASELFRHLETDIKEDAKSLVKLVRQMCNGHPPDEELVGRSSQTYQNFLISLSFFFAEKVKDPLTGEENWVTGSCAVGARIAKLKKLRAVGAPISAVSLKPFGVFSWLQTPEDDAEVPSHPPSPAKV